MAVGREEKKATRKAKAETWRRSSHKSALSVLRPSKRMAAVMGGGRVSWMKSNDELVGQHGVQWFSLSLPLTHQILCPVLPVTSACAAVGVFAARGPCAVLLSGSDETRYGKKRRRGELQTACEPSLRAPRQRPLPPPPAPAPTHLIPIRPFSFIALLSPAPFPTPAHRLRRALPYANPEVTAQARHSTLCARFSPRLLISFCVFLDFVRVSPSSSTHSLSLPPFPFSFAPQVVDRLFSLTGRPRRRRHARMPFLVAEQHHA